MLGFFLRTNFDFLTSHFWRGFEGKNINVLSLNCLRNISPVIIFRKVLKVAILANLEQLTRDMFRVIKA